MIHILHIRKTGGSAVRDAIAPYASTLGFTCADHALRLQDVPAGDEVVFTVRDPIGRFCSGFNSRLRCGRPRNDRPWTPAEAQAFGRFPTPNALAEALGSQQDEDRREAEAAVQAIPHLVPLGFWLGDVETLERRAADIALIMWQAELEQDFVRLRQRLGGPPSLRLPIDDIGSHRTPPGFSVELSARGRDALARWYAVDYALYQWCLDMRAARVGKTAGR